MADFRALSSGNAVESPSRRVFAIGLNSEPWFASAFYRLPCNEESRGFEWTRREKWYSRLRCGSHASNHPTIIPPDRRRHYDFCTSPRITRPSAAQESPHHFIRDALDTRRLFRRQAADRRKGRTPIRGAGH